MKLGGYRESGNVDDRRGLGGRGLAIGGGGIGVVVVAVVAMLLGVDPSSILDPASMNQPGVQQPVGPQPGQRDDDGLAKFSRQVLASTEDIWSQILPGYRAPTLVLYDGVTDAGGCGTGQAAMGPFYCPPDQKLYVDLSFYRELAGKYGAAGDFAQAYVLAHEVGHHVQRLLGTSAEAQTAMRRAGKREANQISVRVELQADCYAGVWAHHAAAAGQLEAGDIEEGITAAEAVGDDRLQAQATGRVMPDSFTHGSSAQRRQWFHTGYERGDLKACDTFGAGV
jgi:predicted metalloprotease